MNAIHTLSLKTAAAVSRLATLESKRQKVNGGDSRVSGAAVAELRNALDMLHVAVEQLEELNEARSAADAKARRVSAHYDEFFSILPVAVIFTDQEGQITSANTAAATLLNLSGRFLDGKPLVLYVEERDRFLQLLKSTTADGFDGEYTIRPRDRKSRRMRVTGKFLDQQTQWCWFFTPVDQPGSVPD